MNITKNEQQILEELIDNFLKTYIWLDVRLTSMTQEHRDAVGLLLEKHPGFLFHLKNIFDKNLNEDGTNLKKEDTWYCTREEATLMAALGIPYEDDEIVFTNYVKGSGIIGLDGLEMDSAIKD